MRYEFPYFRERPHVPITIIVKGKQKRFLPLPDTGADCSVFRKIDAIQLGLNWQKGAKHTFENSDGSSFTVRKFRVQIKIENKKFPATICFTEKNTSAMPLLGRQDVFKHFKITIDEKNQEVILKPHV